MATICALMPGKVTLGNCV